MTTARAPTRPVPQAGFTMLELMLVAGAVAVLMGLGLGFLGRSSGLPEARSAVVAELRLAALDARSRGLPTEVAVQPAGQGGHEILASVRSRGLVPVAVLAFEPGQRPAVAGLDPRFGGRTVDGGRCGAARALDGPDAGPALTMTLGPTVADFRDGFAVRLDVLLLERAAGQLLQLGEGLDVRLDGDGLPWVRVVARGDDGRAGDGFNLRPQTALPVGRWCTFEIGADGGTLWCALDGRVLTETTFADRLHQENGDLFELLPTGEPLAAVVDELQLFAYAYSEPVVFAEGLILREPVRVRFDALGDAEVSGPIQLHVVSEDRDVEWTIGAGGLLQ